MKIINGVHFTPRELDVISCIVSGRSPKKIALLLSVSSRTAENHKHNIMLKIGCGSKENMIDFIEKSGKLTLVKKHYFGLLIQATFEKQLRKISTLINEKPPVCTIICDKEQKHILTLISHLEEHLKLVGIKVAMNFIKENSAAYFSEKLEQKDCDYILYDLSSSSIEQFNTMDNGTDVSIPYFIQLASKNKGFIFFLMLERSLSTNISKMFENCTYIDLLEQKNYYFFIFEILKKVLPNNIEKSITEFKTEYEMFFNPLAFPEQLNIQQEAEKNTNSNTQDKHMKKLTLLAWLIIPLLISCALWFILEAKKETRSLKQKSQKIMAAPINHTENSKYNTTKQIILNLPPRNGKFTGREHNLIQIQKQLNNKKVGIITQAIVGLGGIGKTQLAAEFAYKAIETKCYEAILWINAENPNVMHNAYKKIADYFQINTESLNIVETQSLVHNNLSKIYKEHQILLILDNVQNYKDIKNYLNLLHEQLSVCIVPHILITSRSQNWPESPLIIDTFTPQEASTFVKKHLPEVKEASINKLNNVLNYFPLALSQAVAYIKAHTNIDDYIEAYMDNSKNYLNEASFNYNDQYTESLWNTWNITLTKLSRNGQKIAFISAYLDPDDIPIEFFSNLTSHERMEAIEDLRNHSLIMLTNDNKSFKIHRLLQEVIVATKQPKIKGLIPHNYWLTETFDLLKNKFDFNYLEFTQWNLWEKYLTHARTIAEHSLKKQNKLLFVRGIKLCAKVAMFMTHILVDNTNETAKIWLKLLEVTEKCSLKQPDSSSTALMYANLGNQRRFSNKSDEAKVYFDRAITIYSNPNQHITRQERELINILRLFPLENNLKISDETQYDLIFTLTQLGNVFNYSTVNPNMAALYFNEALRIINKIENIDQIKNVIRYQKINTLYNASKAHIYLGNLGLAEQLLNNAKDLADQVYTNHIQQALTYLILAHFYTYTGKFQESNKYFQKSFNILSPRSDKHFTIYILKAYKGCNAYLSGDNILAKNLLEETVTYWSNLNNNYFHWFSKLHLARVYESIGEYDKALRLTRESVAMVKKYYKENLHDHMMFQLPRSEKWTKVNQSINITFCKKMLALSTQLFGENHYQVARYYKLYGQALANVRHFQLAKTQYEKAIIILKKEEIKHPNLVKFNQQNLQILQELIQEITI